ncbi:MAG: hypothetical protein HY791_09865 [Deltaproteobacteria bacterium]|nr:hypothetical protein [Deltaproteobacteria bacterium]
MLTLSLFLLTAPWSEELGRKLAQETVQACLERKIGEVLRSTNAPYAVFLTDNRSGEAKVDAQALAQQIARAVEKRVGRGRVRTGQRYGLRSLLEGAQDGADYRLTLALFDGPSKTPVATCVGSLSGDAPDSPAAKEAPRAEPPLPTENLRPPASTVFTKWVFVMETDPSAAVLGWGCATQAAGGPNEAEYRATVGAWLGMNALSSTLTRGPLSRMTATDKKSLDLSLAQSKVQIVATWLDGERICARASISLEELISRLVKLPSLGPGTDALVRNAFGIVATGHVPVEAGGPPAWTTGKGDQGQAASGVGMAEGIRDLLKFQQAADARAIEDLLTKVSHPGSAEIIARWFDPREGRLYSLAWRRRDGI